jgi:hypothetical protein
MMIKAKRIELMTMLGNLRKVGNMKGFKLAYAVARNKRALELEDDALNNALASSDEHAEYEKKRLQLCEKYGEKDEAGNPKIEKGRYVGLHTIPEWKKEHDDLTEEYKDVLEAERQKKVDYNNMLEEEIEIDMFMVGIDQIPQDVTVDQMDALMLMIRDYEGVIESAEPETPKE